MGSLLFWAVLVTSARAFQTPQGPKLLDRTGARELAVVYGRGLVRNVPKLAPYKDIMVDADVWLSQGVWFCTMKGERAPVPAGDIAFYPFFMIAVEETSGAFLGATVYDDAKWRKGIFEKARRVAKALPL